MAESTFNNPINRNKPIPYWVWGLLLLSGLGIGLAAQSVNISLAIMIVPLAIVSGTIMLIRPLYITYLLVLTFPFLSTLPRDLLPIPLKIDEILIVLGLVAFVISPHTSKRLRFTKIDLMFILLVAAGTILPTIGTLIREVQPDWLNVIALVKPYLLFRLVVMTIDTRQKVRCSLILLMLPPILVSIIALLQLYNFGDMQGHLANIYYDTPAVQVLTRNISGIGSFLRATSTLGNWNALGSYSALAAFLSISIWRTKSDLRFRNLPGISFASSLGSLLLAGSSSSFFGFISGGMVVIIGGLRRIRIRKKHLVGFALVILVMIVLYLIIGSDIIQAQVTRQSSPYIYDRASEQYYPTYGLPASLMVRWYLAKHLFLLISNDQTAFVTGFGENEYSLSLLPWGTAESGYVGMFFFYGPFYVLFYFMLMFTAFLYSWRIGRTSINQDKTLYNLSLALNGMIVSMVVMNIISSYYSAAGTSHIFFITMALLMSCMRPRLPDAG